MSDVSVETPSVFEEVEGTSGREARGVWVSRVVLIVLSILFVFPFYWMVATTLKTTEEMGASPRPSSRRSWSGRTSRLR